MSKGSNSSIVHTHVPSCSLHFHFLFQSFQSFFHFFLLDVFFFISLISFLLSGKNNERKINRILRSGIIKKKKNESRNYQKRNYIIMLKIEEVSEKEEESRKHLSFEEERMQKKKTWNWRVAQEGFNREAMIDSLIFISTLVSSFLTSMMKHI